MLHCTGWLSYCLFPSTTLGTLICDKYIDKKDVHHILSGRKNQNVDSNIIC